MTAIAAVHSVAGYSFTNLAAVMGLALAAPLLAQARPALRIPSAVVEIVLGIVLGPQVLGWVHADGPVIVLSELGLAALLFLAGLEIDVSSLRHGLRRLLATYALSVGIALLLAVAIGQVEKIDAPLLVGFALASSTVGMVVPILRDADASQTAFGQSVLAGASIGEFGAIVLLSLFFSGHSGSTGSRLLVFALFGLALLVITLVLSGLSHLGGVHATLERLERTSAQLGVRAAIAVVGGFAALASALGLETVLAVFATGVILRLADQEQHLTHSEFRLKVEAIGYGFLVPVFFVTSGMQLHFRALFHDPSHLLLVPVFALGLLVARGLPALVNRRELGARETAALALLQSVSLPVIVIAANLGRQLHVFDYPTDAALVLAGVLSVVAFPSTALAILEGGELPAAAIIPRRPQAAPHSPAEARRPGPGDR